MYKTILKYLLVSFWIINSIIVLSQDSTRVYKKFYYDSGKLSSEGYYYKNNPDGYWKNYYENGKIKSEGNRRNNMLDSVWKFYTDSGTVKTIITYKNNKKSGRKTTYNLTSITEEDYVDDIRHGKSITYYKNDKIHFVYNFIKGKEQGIAREFSPDGLVISLFEYKDGYLVSKEFINRRDKLNQKQGIWKEFFDNETLKTECTYRDNRKNGYYKEYSSDGNLIKIIKYNNDIIEEDAKEVAKHDLVYTYYDDGKMKSKGSFLNNVPNGLYMEFDTNGRVTTTRIYKSGNTIASGISDENATKNGEWKEFYETSELKAIGKYKNNYKFGLWTYYYQNGKVEQTGYYNSKGKPEGEWKWFYESGSLMREETYANGLSDGMMTEYNDSTMTIISKGKYIEGLEEGLWLYQVGDYRAEGKYKDGKRDGVWKYYYNSNNRIFFEGRYLDDEPVGKHTYYWTNGNIKEVGVYIRGLKEGEWRKYTEEGELFLTISYKNDNEIRYNGVKIKPEDDAKDLDDF